MFHLAKIAAQITINLQVDSVLQKNMSAYKKYVKHTILVIAKHKFG